MLAHTLQHIDEVRVRVDALQTARGDQALHNSNVLGTNFGPTEEPVAPAHGDRTQGALDVVGIDGHCWVVEKNSQPLATLADVSQRLRQRIARQQALLLELLVDPVEELVDQRFAVRQPVQPFGFALEFEFSDFLFDLVDRGDLLERLADVFGLGFASKMPRLECAQH